ncbi:MAG: transporter [Caldimonas sp.]
MTKPTRSCHPLPKSIARAIVLTLIAGIAHPARAADATAESDLSVTPYRPSVSTPASLSAPGYLEFELGGVAARSAGSSRRQSLPYDLKLAFNRDWGLRVSGDAWVRQTDSTGERLKGFGDTSVVLKHRIEVNDASAFGVELGATGPTARSGLGIDRTAYLLTGIYSADIGSWHTDLNLAATRFGTVEGPVGRTQRLWAASLSRALSDRVGVSAELSGTNQRGMAATSQLLLAASYAVSKTLVLDAGLAQSLRTGAADRSFFAGMTVLGPRLF